jgi:hypothetical protein
MQNTETSQTTNMLEMAKTWTPAKKSKPGRKSKLNPYEDAIGYLKKERKFSYKDIHDFLIDKGIQVSYPTLVHFAKKRFSKKTPK